jgi:ATP-dependent Lhr-like helicase
MTYIKNTPSTDELGLSVFTSLPMMTVFHGNREIGFLDQLALQIEVHNRSRNPDLPLVLTLAGRHWEITHVDWRARRVHVAESKLPGKSRWLGGGRAYSFALAQQRLFLLTSRENSPRWSQRTETVITGARGSFDWLDQGALSLRPAGEGAWEIWTHVGTKANSSLAGCFPGKAEHVSPFHIRITWGSGIEELVAKIRHILTSPIPRPTIDHRELDALKFSECLSVTMVEEMLGARAEDAEAWDYLRGARVKVVQRTGL